MSKAFRAAAPAIAALAALLVGCTDAPRAVTAPVGVRASVAPAGDLYTFTPPVYDIAASPDGGILVAENTTIREIRRGEVGTVADVPTLPGSAVNGLSPVGRGDLFATSAGLDLAVGAGVWRVSHGAVRLVGDAEAFESENDPDAFEGPQWKDVRCEALAGFGAGPQSNPYHLAATSGGTVLVGDAAGNTLLSARTDGTMDWVALFTPPQDEEGAWQAWGALEDGTDCYVQPVPTSVDVGPEGAYYVGELTGVPATPGDSRVWKIDPGVRHVLCPSDECQEAISGLTSVIDLEFGPDGYLYVVEYDTAGWLAALGGAGAGGAIEKCDVGTGVCEAVADGLELPGAIAFDADGQLWVLEGNVTVPTVRRVNLP